MFSDRIQYIREGEKKKIERREEKKKVKSLGGSSLNFI
jgi:hypothetical protein